MPATNPVATESLNTWLDAYGIDSDSTVEPAVSPNPAADSRYLVDSAGKRYVMTLFEPVAAAGLADTIALMDHLSAAGLPVPDPLPTLEGGRTCHAKGLTAMLVTAPPGIIATAADTGLCHALGQALGRLHRGAEDFGPYRDSDCGPRWWRETAEALSGDLDPESADTLNEEIRFQGLYRFTDLPQGITHGDCRPANVFVDDGAVTGLLGFEASGRDTLLMDVALAANGWCSREDGSLDFDRLGALLAGYHARRPLTAIERGAWPVVIRGAALRRWLAGMTSSAATGKGAADTEGLRHILEQRTGEERALRRHWV